MLQAFSDKSMQIERMEQDDVGVNLYAERGRLRIIPVTISCIRISYTCREQFVDRQKPGIAEHDRKDRKVAWRTCETASYYEICTDMVCIRVDKQTGSIGYYRKDGTLYVRERGEESREMEEYTSFRLLSDSAIQVEKIQTADGEKSVIKEAPREESDKLYRTRMHLEWQEDEALYGLGQHEEGNLNLRGKTVYLHQGNRKIAIPMLVSDRNYGILLNTYAPAVFHDTEFGSYLYTEADDELDFYFFGCESMKDVIKEYRRLTGKAAMLPKWAFGYIQSQERYETQEELLQVVQEYRDRHLGLDGIVLDWCSWEDGRWGQKTFDFSRFPDPGQMIRKMHEKDVHFMISIWPNMDENCDNYKEMKEAGGTLPGTAVYNAFEQKYRDLYWQQVKRGLYRFGVDSWWCDSSEPITPEWNHKEKPEPSMMYQEYCTSTRDVFPAWATNAYGLYHAQTLYEGQRSEAEGDKKRVLNLTRSAYIGQQRYGTILWSGDTAAGWDTFRHQIAAGLSFSASGLPYWTTDIGAFFVKNGFAWYWKGRYDNTIMDAGYRELYVRWFQWAAFLPIFRGHGTDCRREMWQFADRDGAETMWPANFFYNALVKMNRLRYELLPFIYSQAGKVWLYDESMMEPLAFSYAQDRQVVDLKDEYLFGDAFLVAPVTEPMYFGENSTPLTRKEYTRSVYLPEGNGWYDYWTNRYYMGGQWIQAEATLDVIPLYVKEGTILPVALKAEDCEKDSAIESTGEEQKLFYRIYRGRDCEYVQYEDAGDGYGYERGEYQLTKLSWKEALEEFSADCKTDLQIQVIGKEGKE